MRTSSVRWVVRCCYLGMLVQATVLNFAPPLFIPLKSMLGLTFEQIGRLVLINFCTQVSFDLICGPLIDRIGPKPFSVGANVLACVGLWLFALLPGWTADPYHGLMIGTIVFSIGCGILELVLSPIINALPSEQKASDMSLLHSFYGIGQAMVVLFTSLAVFAIGAGHWRWIVLGWSVLPAVAACSFAVASIPPLIEEHRRQRLRELVRRPVYLGCVMAIGLAGATEVSLAQWTSAFAEKGLGFSKVVGDLGGLCAFATAMAAGRLWFGFRGQKACMYRVMLAGAYASFAAYLVAAVSPWPAVSLLMCVCGGLSVSLLWPGMLSVTAARFPLTGASMFALMSAAGDTGAATMPWIVGVVADQAAGLHQWLIGLFGRQMSVEQAGLRAGLLVAGLCPIIMAGLLHLLWRESSRRRSVEPASGAMAVEVPNEPT